MTDHEKDLDAFGFKNGAEVTADGSMHNDYVQELVSGLAPLLAELRVLPPTVQQLIWYRLSDRALLESDELRGEGEEV